MDDPKKTENPLLSVLAFGALTALLFPVFLQILSNAENHHRRGSSCVNNLKQFGLILGMYANEHGGHYPVIDDVKNNFIFEGDDVFPEYLTDPVILACPSDPDFDYKTNFRLTSNFDHPDSLPGEVHPDCFTDMSYCYLGWLITSQKEAEAFFEAYDKMSPDDYDKDIVVPEGMGNGGGNIIYRLDTNLFAIPEGTGLGPATTFKIDPAKTAADIPIMWDKPSADIRNISHLPAGINVLYLDGHVEFHRYDKSLDDFPMGLTFSKLLDERPRAPIPDYDGFSSI